MTDDGCVTSYILLHTHQPPAFDLACPGWLGYAEMLLGIRSQLGIP